MQSVAVPKGISRKILGKPFLFFVGTTALYHCCFHSKFLCMFSTHAVRGSVAPATLSFEFVVSTAWIIVVFMLCSPLIHAVQVCSQGDQGASKETMWSYIIFFSALRDNDIRNMSQSCHLCKNEKDISCHRHTWMYCQCNTEKKTITLKTCKKCTPKSSCELIALIL